MESVHNLVDNLRRRLEFHNYSARRQALSFWTLAVGETISSMCSVEGFSETTVVIRAYNPAVAMELQYRSNEIIIALNESAGKELFQTLKIILRPTSERER